MTNRKVLLVLGAGQRLGISVTRRFLNEGFRVILVSRNENNLNLLKQCLKENVENIFTYKADIANEGELKSILYDIYLKFPSIDALFYNVAQIVKKNILEETENGLINDFTINVVGLLIAVQTLKENLILSKGAVLVSGGGIAIQPFAEYSSYSISSSALRSLVLCLHNSFIEYEVYAGILLINGPIDNSSQTYSPVNISNVFWQLYFERSTPELIL